jgi:hypothetical protein
MSNWPPRILPVMGFGGREQMPCGGFLVAAPERNPSQSDVGIEAGFGVEGMVSVAGGEIEEFARFGLSFAGLLLTN